MDLVLRTAIGFVVIVFVTRVVGRRELSSMEPFDLVMLVVLGDLIQQGVTQSDYSVTGLIIVIFTLTLLVAFTSWLNFRFPAARSLLSGEPLILVEDGRVIRRNLQRERITVGEVMGEARQQGIASLDAVRWAVLETSGRISFIQRETSPDG